MHCTYTRTRIHTRRIVIYTKRRNYCHRGVSWKASQLRNVGIFSVARCYTDCRVDSVTTIDHSCSFMDFDSNDLLPLSIMVDFTLCHRVQIQSWLNAPNKHVGERPRSIYQVARKVGARKIKARSREERGEGQRERRKERGDREREKGGRRDNEKNHF